MKPTTPHDPFDDLIAAALHGELTPAERAQFDSRIANDPAAQAAYHEAQAMNDLLEKTHQSAQPDPAFEQRMVSAVRRKLHTEQHRETSWESAVILWKTLSRILGGRSLWTYGGVCSLFLVLALMAVIYSGSQVKGVFTTISSQLAMASSGGAPEINRELYSPDSPKRRNVGTRLTDVEAYADDQKQLASADKTLEPSARLRQTEEKWYEPITTTTPQGGTIRGSGFQVPTAPVTTPSQMQVASTPPQQFPSNNFNVQSVKIEANKAKTDETKLKALSITSTTIVAKEKATDNAASAWDANWKEEQAKKVAADQATAPDSRKLIRNATLDLEVKSFQAAMDEITAQTKAAGGYVDTSNSQKGGNGKLQGTVVVKVLPQNLDGFLLKLRDLGNLTNQSVSTDDVTKDYFDTQARLVNSQKMEAQLQDLLKRENGKVSDLLAVERELGRVRGDIEQMQGQLKLYDFQVQYATVSIQMREKDLNQAAAYLLKEQDDFSLFATDVEGTFKSARQAADSVKAQVLTANLNHNSGSDVSAELVVMVAPDQIESFLGQVRGLGRVANFTRQTQRVAKDGGDSDQPADQTLTEKDKVQVHLAIRSDDETRKQVALTVVAKEVDDALDQAKVAALANAGVEVLSSSLNKTPQGQSTAQLTVRVPGRDYATVIAAFKALGRTASLSIQRNDDSGPGANGDDAPVIVSLSLTDTDAPLQQTALAIRASDVDASAQQIKKAAGTDGVEVKASSFERQPDGTELAQMTFRLPMGKYPAFLETVKALGKVESLSVQRNDRPDQTVSDDTAPVEINLQLHNQRDIVADDTGLLATLRQTFGEGAGALFGSIRVIGVLIAFALPWVVTLVILAWIGRRIYVWRKGK